MTLQVGANVVREMIINGAQATEAWYGGKCVWKRTQEGIAAFVVVTADTEIPYPAWAEMVDVVGIGAGGSGSGGFAVSSASGKGGQPGKWGSTVWYANPGRTLKITIGKPGPGDGTGTATVVRNELDDWTLTCAPGPANGSGSGNATGIGAAAYTFGNISFPGGGNVGIDTAGSVPGGGGGGGSGWVTGFNAGKPGGRGQVWLRFRSY